jgi:hypothetical protein
MIRINKLIKKDELFTYLSNPDIAKIELTKRKNKDLTNPYLCKVFMHMKVDWVEFCNMLGVCKIQHNVERNWEKGDKGFLNGIQSCKKDGFMRSTHILKLMDIENKYQINLAIPKEYKQLIEKYN